MLFHDSGGQQRSQLPVGHTRSQPLATAVGVFRVDGGPQCFQLRVCQCAVDLLRHNLVITQEAAADVEASESGW